MMLACPITQEEFDALPAWMQTFKAAGFAWLGVGVYKGEYRGCCGLNVCYGGTAWTTSKPLQERHGYIIYPDPASLKDSLSSYLCDGVRSSLFADVQNGLLIGLARWVFGEDKLELVWENVNKNSGNKIFLWILRS